MKITISSNKLKKTTDMLKQWSNLNPDSLLESVGKESCKKLADVSPVRTGEFKAGWNYEISKVKNGTQLVILNDSHKDVPDLAYLLEFGHAGKFGYIPPKNFIIPTMNKMYDKIENDWGDVLDYGKYR